ncbi:MAG: peptidylprolyl isomerase [Alphaproteobacteria bacterium]|nr:peptidylprolyl isomerase [Alphaproteobacteria bacterium]
MSKRILLAAALMLGASSVPALAADAPKGGDPVIGRVNGQEIHRSDFIRQLQMMGTQAQQLPPQMLYPQVLQKMIATRLVSAQGYAQKLQDDKDVKAQLKEAEAQIVAEAYVRRTIQPKITEAKIKERYEQLSSKFKPEDEIRARHILVQTEDEAKTVLKQLKDGADFAKLAEEKSKDKGSAKQGGDLGYFPRGAMVKAFADAAFAMKAGELSDKPVKTEFGYHIIKVEDKRKSAPPPIAEVRDQIANQLGQELTNELVKGLEAKAKVEKFNIDGSPMKTASDSKAKE